MGIENLNRKIGLAIGLSLVVSTVGNVLEGMGVLEPHAAFILETAAFAIALIHLVVTCVRSGRPVEAALFGLLIAAYGVIFVLLS